MNQTKESVVSEQYTSSKKLKMRSALHEKFANPSIWEHLWNTYPFSDGANILEVGCGTGNFWKHSKTLLPSNCKITLTDWSAQMLEEAKQALVHMQNTISYCEASLESLPFQQESYDVVLAHFVLYHASFPRTAVAELERVLRKGGWAGVLLSHRQSMQRIFDLAHSVEASVPREVQMCHSYDPTVAESDMQNVFSTVKKYNFEDILKVTDSSPVISYFLSNPIIDRMRISNEFLNNFQLSIDREIQEKGFFGIPRSRVLFLGTK